MKGNFHVQFLGEGVAATSPPYPTPGGAIPWGPRPGTPKACARFEASPIRSKQLTELGSAGTFSRGGLSGG